MAKKRTVSRRQTSPGVMVIHADPRRVKKALRLMDRQEKGGKTDPEAITALRFYRMAKKFFRQGGRFKRRYTHKAKKKQN